MSERAPTAQITEADDVNGMGDDDRHAYILDLIRRRDRLIWELKRAERENANLHARLDVPYRPGLPTVEQVRAHEQRGGCWHYVVDAGRLPKVIRMEVVEVQMGGREFAVVVGGNPVSPSPRPGESSRPCLPDGTPCAWPEVGH